MRSKDILNEGEERTQRENRQGAWHQPAAHYCAADVGGGHRRSD